MAASRDLNALVDRLLAGGGTAVDVEGQPILFLPVYETPRSQAELYLLRSGQRIPAHRHSAIDDVFVGVRGRGRVRVWDADGKHEDHTVEPGSVVVVEPGSPHEVSCAGEEFCYVLTQSPKEAYDSVSYTASEAVDDV
ncbi:cupin domain-containing protein [bacterium]|nr:MAG: cupin domain-containing protein [bacterium]